MTMNDRYRDGSGPRLRLDTLVRLRWLAMAGQSAAVLITHFGLGFPLPLLWCGVVIVASALMNVALRLYFDRNARLDRPVAAVALAWDIAQLSALLYLAGGLQIRSPRCFSPP